MFEYQRTGKRRCTILLVEDDSGFQELTRRALHESAVPTDLRIVENGAEALEYLRRRGTYADPQAAPRPDLILLDLNMPRMNGRELLQILKEEHGLGRIPVVVLATSKQAADIQRSYDLGCNSYIQKPGNLEQFVSAVRRIVHYWFDVVTLPSASPS